MDVVDCPGLVAAAAKGRPENVAAQTAQLVRRFVVDGWCPGGPRNFPVLVVKLVRNPQLIWKYLEDL